jgi:(p)ppGpp synthase/HD superfamily hydrolase
MGIERKYCGSPYITHPIRVAERMVQMNMGHAEDTLCAALLHDCLEDADVHGNKMNSRMIEAQCGAKVLRHVQLLTKRKLGSRAATNEAYTRQLLQAPIEVQAIKLADILDNVTGIADCDPKFAEIYLAEKKAQALAITTTGPTPAHVGANKLKSLVLDQISHETNQVAIYVLNMMRDLEAERVEDERAIAAMIAEEHDREFAEFAAF